MTIIDIARHHDVSARTADRWVKAGHEHQEWLNLVNDGNPFPHGKNDRIPDRAYQYLIRYKGAPSPPFGPENGFLATMREKADTISDPDAEKGSGSAVEKPFKFEATLLRRDDGSVMSIPKHDEPLFTPGNFLYNHDKKANDTPTANDSQRQPTTSLSDNVFRNDIPAFIALSILIGADSFSAGWIAQQAFNNWVATTAFALVGYAVAYAAIRNAVVISDKPVIGYAGQTKYSRVDERRAREIADRWLWGFGVFQLLLHAAALQMFSAASYTDLSMAIGKWIICICIPMGTTGIAITFKK